MTINTKNIPAFFVYLTRGIDCEACRPSGRCSFSYTGKKLYLEIFECFAHSSLFMPFKLKKRQPFVKENSENLIFLRTREIY
jgi:hypothetical protein